MNLADTLASPPPPEPSRRDKPAIPNAGDPGTMAWDGTTGVLHTQPVTAQPASWDAYLIEAGLDPAVVEVLEPVGVRGWQVQRKIGDNTSVEWLHYYSLRVQRRRSGPGIEDLLGLVRKRRSPVRPATTSTDTATYVIATGDWQLGKCDGDGIEGAVNRITSQIEQAAADYRTNRKRRNYGPIHLALLGDHIEGFESQGGDQAWRTTLTLTEQVRLYRRLILMAIDTLAPLTDRMSVVAVGGNHGEAKRFGKGVTRYDDNWDVEALVAVSDAMKINPDAYGHVVCHVPGKDELTVTLDCGGTIIGHAHGHMSQRGKLLDWWKGQAWGGSLLAEATVLLTGHFHSLSVQQDSGRTAIQVPAEEGESTWWRHRTGSTGQPGMVTFTARNGGWSDLTVLH